MKPKSILIVSPFFPPVLSVASLRVYSYAKYWARMGHEVTILTTKKFDEGGEVLNLTNEQFVVIEVPYLNLSLNATYILKKMIGMKRNPPNMEKDSETMNAIEHRRNQFSKIKHALTKITHKFSLFTMARIPSVTDTWIRKAFLVGQYQLRKKQYDWIFSSYGPPASHIVAGLLRKKNGCKWVADYRDLWLEGHIYPGLWPFTSLERYLENKYVGGYADIITTVSEPLADVLRKKFSVPVHVIENGYDEDDYNKRFSLYFTTDKKRIIYTGTIYPRKQDPSPLFIALSSLANESEKLRKIIDERLEILFFGNESLWLKNLIQKHHVDRWVKYKGVVSREDVLRIQNQADVFLFLEWEDSSLDGILTGKLFEYLAMKKPILGIGGSSRTSPGTLMEEAGVGLAVGKDIEKIRKILINLLEGRTPFPTLPNEDVIQRYTRKKQAIRILEIMDKLDGIT